MKDNHPKQRANGGKWRNSRSSTESSVRWGSEQDSFCKGMRSDTEEGGAKGCKARRSLPKVLQMVWASSRRLTSGLGIITVGGGQCKVYINGCGGSVQCKV